MCDSNIHLGAIWRVKFHVRDAGTLAGLLVSKFGRVKVARLQIRISSLGRLLILTILGCGGAQAANSACGVQAVNLLANGKINALSALFREPSQLVEPLDQLAKHLGAVSGVRAVDAPRHGQ